MSRLHPIISRFFPTQTQTSPLETFEDVGENHVLDIISKDSSDSTNYSDEDIFETLEHLYQSSSSITQVSNTEQQTQPNESSINMTEVQIVRDEDLENIPHITVDSVFIDETNQTWFIMPVCVPLNYLPCEIPEMYLMTQELDNSLNRLRESVFEQASSSSPQFQPPSPITTHCGSS